MQLIIIHRHGQCRGRPPTGTNNREGPGTVVSRQSSVGSQQSSVGSWQSDDGCCRSDLIRQRIGFRRREPVLPLIALSALVKMLRSHDPGSINSFIVYRKNVFKNSLARDWPTYTCSVSNNIKQNRDNDRWSTTTDLTENVEAGELCPVVKPFKLLCEMPVVAQCLNTCETISSGKIIPYYIIVKN